jgi:HEAT repeat protein
MRYLLLGLVVLLAGCEKPTALEVLGNVGTTDPAAIPALIAAVRDRDPSVRGAAILALLKIGPDAEEAIPVLSAAQKDPDARVRSYAAKALERIQTVRQSTSEPDAPVR